MDIIQNVAMKMSDSLSKEQLDKLVNVSKCGVEYMFRQLSEKTGIKAHPHKFRRTLLTNGSHRGMSVQELQKYAGHVKIDTTMTYIDIENEDVRSSFNRHIG